MTSTSVVQDGEGLAGRVASLEKTVSTLAPRLDSALARLFELERMAGSQWLAEGGRDEAVAEMMLDELVLPVSMRLSAAQGLHRLEYDEEGRPFRWTGPSAEFGFNGYVNRRRMGVVKLDVLWKGPTTDIAQTRCFVDDQEVVLEAQTTSDGWTLKGVAPPRAAVRMTTFRFIAPELFRVSPDSDLLGLAIRSFAYRSRTHGQAVGVEG